MPTASSRGPGPGPPAAATTCRRCQPGRRLGWAQWLGLSLAFSGSSYAQVLRPGPPPCATYHYTAYTVYDHTAGDPPTHVAGVGGTLTLFPTGAYEKRLRITGPNGLIEFPQHGQCTLRGDSIRFAFTDAKGFDVQRGTYRYDARTRRLTIAIAGYPPGNQGVYELVADAASGPRPAPKRR